MSTVTNDGIICRSKPSCNCFVADKSDTNHVNATQIIKIENGFVMISMLIMPIIYITCF